MRPREGAKRLRGLRRLGPVGEEDSEVGLRHSIEQVAGARELVEERVVAGQHCEVEVDRTRRPQDEVGRLRIRGEMMTSRQ